MRCVSWNVNGLRAVAQKGFHESVAALDADVILLQETKARLEDLDESLTQLPGYELRIHPAQKRGYSGVAIYTRQAPDEWIEGIDAPEFDAEGRVLSARFGEVLVTSAYFPNSQAKGGRIDYRLAFGERIRDFLDQHRQAGRTVLLGGDLNVAHQPIDLARPKPNVGNPGFLPAEREWMTEFLEAGYVDTWRRRNPATADVYSWWSYRSQARSKNVGWRLDYFCIDAASFPFVSSVAIHTEIEGSDHCPVGIDLDVSPDGKLAV